MTARHVHRSSGGALGACLVATLLIVLATAALLAAPARAADSGDLLWSNDWVYSTSSDLYTDVASGPAGSVYTGGTVDADGDVKPEMILAKYKADGGIEWTRMVDGPDYDGSHGVAVAVDDTGAAVIAGHSQTTLSQAGVWLVTKYSAAGVLQWKTTTTLSGAYDAVKDVEVDGAGNVYVVGIRATTPMLLVLIKYDAAHGSELWRRFVYTRGDYVLPRDLAVDAAGNAFVVGEEQATDAPTDCLLARWKPDGTRAWLAKFDGGHHGEDYLNQLVLSTTRKGTSLYAAGVYGVSDTHDHAVLLKYRLNGTRLWQRAYNYALRGPASTNGLAVDRRGRPCAINNFAAGSRLLRKAWLTRWTGGGTRLWKTSYPSGKAKTGALFYDVVCDGSGRIWCGGGTSLQAPDYPTEWLLARYRTDGTRAWVRRWYPDPGEKGAVCNLVCLSGADALYAVGFTLTDATSADFLVRKYVR